MSTDKVSVDVFGAPIQQGSMTAFPFRRKNGSIGVSLVHNKENALTAWREKIRVTFIDKYPEISQAVPDGGYFEQYTPVKLTVCFYLAKPKSSKLPYPTSKKADLDKLIRAVNDALTGVVFYDDCQVMCIDAMKRWADELHPIGAHICVEKY